MYIRYKRGARRERSDWRFVSGITVFSLWRSVLPRDHWLWLLNPRSKIVMPRSGEEDFSSPITRPLPNTAAPLSLSLDSRERWLINKYASEYTKDRSRQSLPRRRGLSIECIRCLSVEIQLIRIGELLARTRSGNLCRDVGAQREAGIPRESNVAYTRARCSRGIISRNRN